MNKYITLITLLFFTLSISAEENSKTIEYDNETYHLKYNASDPIWTVNEYIRENESLETWSKLIAVRAYKNETDPKKVAHALARKLEENSSVLGKRVINKDDEEYLVDFMMQTDDVFEFNIFRYVKRNGILLSYQFAYAARTDRGTLTQIINQDFGDVEDFTSKKNEWIDMMTKVEWVDPKTAAK